MTPGKLLLEPDTLWSKVEVQTQHGLQCGALQPIATHCNTIEQANILFIVRMLDNWKRKQEAKKQQDRKTETSGKFFNPFLPCETDLFVTNISDTHFCLLNKYNIIDRHVLIVTREFEEQENWLNFADFAALWACWAQGDRLAFYNGGETAGASQRHKHLQLVPLSLAEGVEQLPIAPWISACLHDLDPGVVTAIPQLPFQHAIAPLNPAWADSPWDAAESTLACYRNLLRTVGLIQDVQTMGDRQSGSYNLLATRDWMMVVPRQQERYQSISVNALGFAGAFLVRNLEELEILKTIGPIALLQSVAYPLRNDRS
jgi:sulfate adenylyltransferase (ADP) / ATP adenylyltransferase